MLLVQGHVVQLFVGLEELLLAEDDGSCPSSADLAHISEGFACWTALRDRH